MSYITTTQDIKWSCWTSDFSNGKCYSIVSYQGDVLTMYPERQTVKGIGMIDYFKMDNGLVNVYFKTTDLYEGYNYTFEVLCGESFGHQTNHFNVTVGLVNRDLTEVNYRGIWFKNNLPMIGFVAVFLVIALVLIKMIKG